MQQITDFINQITVEKTIDILIAIIIVICFKIFSGVISYIIIKICKWKVKSSKEIKQSAFYSPIKVFISILGIYVAFIFLKQPLEFSEPFMLGITTIFKIVSVIAFAIGIARSFRLDSTLTEKFLEKSHKDMSTTTLSFALKIIRAIIYISATVIVSGILGFNLNGLIAGLGIGGVIVTLAAQDTAKNLFGGIMIFLDKPFIVGDWIQMDNFEGNVEDITFRSTRIRTFENSILNVPNSIITNTAIINWSKMEERRYRFNLTLDLTTPLEKVTIVENRISEMLKKRDNILDDTINVKFDTITDNGINLLICSYTDSVDYASYIKEKERINYNIMQILKEENVELAYDTKTVYIKN